MQPLQFEPIVKRIRWGGRRLGSVLGKRIGDAHDYAESWELVDHGADQSVVMNGPLAGRTLQRLVVEQNRELFGRHAGRDQFPLLVKFLDAHDRLSVQVHPNDDRARRFDPSENGKTEAWVILDAAPGSMLWVGLQPGVGKDELREALRNGCVERCLHALSVRPGDCIFVPAGTVHAIGEGVLLAEIQQSSNLTFRLYDWGRLGADGQPRPLHIDEALDCIDFTRGPVGPVQPRRVGSGAETSEELVRCEQFVIRRHAVQRAFEIEDDDRFHVFVTLAGQFDLEVAGDSLRMPRGTTVLAPAERHHIRLAPGRHSVLLEAFLP
jgi:mannose-6-phosphate isomerase